MSGLRWHHATNQNTHLDRSWVEGWWLSGSDPHTINGGNAYIMVLPGRNGFHITNFFVNGDTGARVIEGLEEGFPDLNTAKVAYLMLAR